MRFSPCKFSYNPDKITPCDRKCQTRKEVDLRILLTIAGDERSWGKKKGMTIFTDITIAWV
jgi:hypothetical protein